jgi:hypothetical protein
MDIKKGGKQDDAKKHIGSNSGELVEVKIDEFEKLINLKSKFLFGKMTFDPELYIQHKA